MFTVEGLWPRATLVAGIVMGALLGSASPGEARNLDQILQTKEIRVGINPTMRPFVELDDRNNYTGLEVEIAKQIAGAMNVNLKLVEISSPDRIPALQSDRIDFMMGYMTRTVPRALVIDFTVPLYSQTMTAITVDGRGISKLADINNEKIRAVNVRGAIGVQWLAKYAPKAKVILLDNIPDSMRQIAQGQADVMVDVVESVAWVFDTYPNVKWKLLDEKIDTNWAALGVQKGNTSLRDFLNVEIYQLQKDGFIDATWLKWFKRPMITPVPFNPYF